MGGGLFWLQPGFIASVWGVIKGRPRWSVWTLVGDDRSLVATPHLAVNGHGLGAIWTALYSGFHRAITVAHGARHPSMATESSSISYLVVHYAVFHRPDLLGRDGVVYVEDDE